MDAAKPTVSNLPSSISYVYVCVYVYVCIYSLVLMYREMICIWDRKQDSKGVVRNNTVSSLAGSLHLLQWKAAICKPLKGVGLFIAELTVHSTCFGHHYAHNQELKSYTDGCCLWYLALWFTGCCSGVELWVMCLLCRMFFDSNRETSHGFCVRFAGCFSTAVEKHPANQTHNPQVHTRPTTCKPKRQ